jgi:hypothetical protein
MKCVPHEALYDAIDIADAQQLPVMGDWRRRL